MSRGINQININIQKDIGHACHFHADVYRRAHVRVHALDYDHGRDYDVYLSHYDDVGDVAFHYRK